MKRPPKTPGEDLYRMIDQFIERKMVQFYRRSFRRERKTTCTSRDRE